MSLIYLLDEAWMFQENSIRGIPTTFGGSLSVVLFIVKGSVKDSA
jgi:hypothetical protein